MIVDSKNNFIFYLSFWFETIYPSAEEMEGYHTMKKSSRLHLQDMDVIIGEELSLFVCWADLI